MSLKGLSLFDKFHVIFFSFKMSERRRLCGWLLFIRSRSNMMTTVETKHRHCHMEHSFLVLGVCVCLYTVHTGNLCHFSPHGVTEIFRVNGIDSYVKALVYKSEKFLSVNVYMFVCVCARKNEILALCMPSKNDIYVYVEKRSKKTCRVMLCYESFLSFNMA